MDNGAQVIQVFESWAHQMIPSQFETFAKPYADLAMSILKQRHPDVPVIYFANGGSSYLESQRDTQVSCGAVENKYFVLRKYNVEPSL